MPTIYRPTRAEHKTVLRWDRAGDQVWSASPVTWRKLERLGIPHVHEERSSGGVVSSRFYRIPLTRFRWGLKRVGVRVPGRRVAVRSVA